MTLATVLILAVGAAGAVARAGDARDRGEWRPRYHFSPARHWMNDPNGLVYLDGEYQLFYQYNPFGDRWGHMSWGHASSRDLTHWRELPVAIPEDADYSIYSGSVVVDRDDTSGLGTPRRPPLVAIYTGASRHGGGQSQHLAYSLDSGTTWTKYPGNPVLDVGVHEFRDPQVFWYGPDHRWVMVTVLADLHQVAFFGSTDLIHWQRLGTFGPAGAVDGAWECPDLLSLPVSNAPGETRWMLKMDVFRSKTASGSGAQYFVGQFDGRTFTEEPGEGARPVDAGRDFYAAASWSNLPPGEGRQIWIAWMNNHEYAKDIPTAPFRGTLTVPREVSLRRTSGGTVLVQTPVREVEALRRDHRRITDLRLTDRGAVTLAGAFPRSAEIEATFAADGADEIGLMVRVGPAEQTVIGYDIRTARIFIDRTRSGRVDFNGRFPGTQSAPLPLADGKLTLRVLLDRASIEVFAGDGAVVLTEQVFPSPGSAALEAYARGGPATLRQADLWRLADAAVP